MIDVVKDNDLNELLTNYIVYAAFADKKENRRCTKCHNTEEVIAAVKEYEDMDSCCYIYVCDKNGNRI